MTENQQLGTADASGSVKCESCNYEGDIETFPPAMGVYQDIRCPQCNSTNNKHNSIYQERLLKNMRRIS